MNKLLLGIAAAALCAVLASSSQAGGNCGPAGCGGARHPALRPHFKFGRIAQRKAYEQSLGLPWHNAYYHAAYGEPYALVVPPTAEYQSNYGWGVSGTRVSPIYHQFARPYPGDGSAVPGTGFMPTPYWPSDTTQFGVYYIRGPW